MISTHDELPPKVPATEKGSCDTNCSTAPCVRFTLYYREEKTNTVQRVESIRQQ